MLYGNGITKLERIVAFEVILGNLIQIFTEAWSIWSDQYSHENDKEGRKVKASYHSVQTLVHAAKTDHLSNELFGGSCYQSLRHLWNNRGLRDTILSWNNPMFNENVP